MPFLSFSSPLQIHAQGQSTSAKPPRIEDLVSILLSNDLEPIEVVQRLLPFVEAYFGAVLPTDPSMLSDDMIKILRDYLTYSFDMIGNRDLPSPQLFLARSFLSSLFRSLVLLSSVSCLLIHAFD